MAANQWNDRYYRSCEWKLHVENMDQLGDEQGYCTTIADNLDMDKMCTCSLDKCNTGFNGPKCHVYKASNCGPLGPRVVGLDDESEPSVMNCLTGTKYCGSSEIGKNISIRKICNCKAIYLIQISMEFAKKNTSLVLLVSILLLMKMRTNA